MYLGFDSKRNSTTTQENYKRYAGVNTNTLDSFTSEDIKKKHFSFGASDVNYKTCNRNYGYLQGSVQKPDEKFLNELKSVHFRFGNDDSPMMTTTMSEYTSKKSPNSKVAKNLKSHSIVLGTYENKWITTKTIDSARNTYS